MPFRTAPIRWLSLTALGLCLGLGQYGCSAPGPKPLPPSAVAAPQAGQPQPAEAAQAQAAGSVPSAPPEIPADEVVLGMTPPAVMVEPVPLVDGREQGVQEGSPPVPVEVVPERAVADRQLAEQKVEVVAKEPVPPPSAAPDAQAPPGGIPPPVVSAQLSEPKADPAAAVAREAGVVPPVAMTASGEVLLPLDAVRGGPEGNAVVGIRQVRFVRPISVAVRTGNLFVVDAGQSTLFRYDLAMKKLSVMLDLHGVITGDTADLHVSSDQSLYIADTYGARVLQYDRKGRLVRIYSNRLNMARPVAVLVDEPSGRVFVADAFYDHILVFDSAGKLVASMGGRGADPGQFLNITAMAQGPDGFYVTARVGEHVQVLGGDGQYGYSLPQEGIVFPTAIAVDAENRVFVSDFSDHAIKVYERGRLVGRAGHPGGELGQFRHISDLWIDDGLLYVADSLNGRVQIMRVASGTESR
ncbi:MAG: hypothetical protein IDH49_11670 [Gammaproteobacteria bacterium]|nr:hypothetical protein [Gammaproteobacteria bacterium]